MDQKELNVKECVVIGAGISGIAVNNREFFYSITIIFLHTVFNLGRKMA